MRETPLKNELTRFIEKAEKDHKCIDNLFLLFLDILRKGDVAVHRIKDLKNPDDGKKISGLLWNKKIYIEDGLDQAELIKTLIHELIHFIFDDLSVEEILVVNMEELIWQKLSEEQKNQLWEYIPQIPSEIVPG